MLSCWNFASLQAAPPVNELDTRGLSVVIGYEESAQWDRLLGQVRGHLQLLDSRDDRLAAAAHRIAELGCGGHVSVMAWHGGPLPYASNLVNGICVTGALPVDRNEVLRVLEPRGVALIADRPGAASWRRVVKPVPTEVDDWTHYLYDASGNAVAHDRRVGNPNNLQWTVDPGQMTRDHDGLASLSCMVSCRGQLYSIVDEGPVSMIHQPSQWRLVARDAFNGSVLWKRDIPDWVTRFYFFRSGPTWLTRRLVARDQIVLATLGLDAPISVIDAHSGRTVRELQGSERTEEFIVPGALAIGVIGDPAKANREAADPYIYTEYKVPDRRPVDKCIAAWRVADGKLVWSVRGDHLRTLAPLSLCARGAAVYYLDAGLLHCVRLSDGKELWTAPYAAGRGYLQSYAPTVVATNRAVLCLTNERLVAFDPKDGARLWEKPGYVGFASPGDLFVINDLAWTLPTVATLGELHAKDQPFLGDDGRQFLGIDLATGKVERTMERTAVWPSGHHHRCYRNKATDQFFICGRRGVEFIDVAGQAVHHNWWIRGICQYGVLPANGLLYVPPDPCRCFQQIKMDGMLAFTTERAPPSEWAGRLISRAGRGGGPGDEGDSQARQTPADEPSGARRLKGQDWPTYRHDVRRSGICQSTITTPLTERWSHKLQGRLSAVTVADGAAYVAEVDAHRLVCLDADAGKVRWTFTTGARVDSPPTIFLQFVLFGARDGWVYALRAADGQLVWKFHAAPADRLIAQDEQFESSWPVNGSLLVLDDIAYFAAGRLSYLDGGIQMYGLRATTGEVVYHRQIKTDEPAGPQKSPGRQEAALAGILYSDGVTIGMRSSLYQADLSPARRPRSTMLSPVTGFLNDSWFHRENWSVGAGKMAPWGKLIVFDDERAWGVQNPYTYIKRTPGLWPDGHRGHHHQQYSLYEPSRFPRGVRLFAQPIHPDSQIRPQPIATTDRRDFKRWEQAAASSTEHHLWTFQLPMQVRAMIRTGNVLWVAGWRDPLEQSADAVSLPGDNLADTPVLYAVNAESGAAIAGYRLEGRPVFDGMAAAGGRLFVPLQNGTLVCFQSRSTSSRP